VQFEERKKGMQAVQPTQALKLNKFRPGQRDAYDTIISRVAQGESSTSIILPTGYGKSDVIRVSAFDLFARGITATSLVISPNDLLRGQIVNGEKMQISIGRYGMTWLPAFYSEIVSVRPNYHANGEFLLSTTIQLVQTNVSHFVSWIDSVVYQTGKPVMVYVDEVHTHTTMNQWGNAIRQLQKAGAHVVVLTATPYRDDGEPIIGFRVIEKANEPITVFKTRPGSEPEKVIVQRWEGTKTQYELVPDYACSFRDAWEQGVICHISRHEIEVDMSMIDGDASQHRMLADLSPTEARRVLGKVVRHGDVIRSGAGMLVDRLKYLRGSGQAYRDCAAIVFTENDEGDETNAHALKVKQAIKVIAPELKVTIATTANDTGKKKQGRDAIERFSDDGDVLIVKQMAGLGLDIERLKVVLDLSSTRTLASVIQRVNRTTRIYNGCTVAHYITPNDILQRTIFTMAVSEQGGESASSQIDLMDEYEKDRGESTLPLFMVNKAGHGDMDDSHRKRAAREQLPLILRVLECFPVLITTHTYPDIAEAASALGVTVADGDMFGTHEGLTNTGDVLADRRSAANGFASDIASLRFFKEYKRRYQGNSDSERWAAVKKQVWNDIYDLAGASVRKIDQISSIDEMERVRAAADRLLDQEMS
jgi:superfamily II DNA or RNA helicase